MHTAYVNGCFCLLCCMCLYVWVLCAFQKREWDWQVCVGVWVCSYLFMYRMFLLWSCGALHSSFTTALKTGEQDPCNVLHRVLYRGEMEGNKNGIGVRFQSALRPQPQLDSNIVGSYCLTILRAGHVSVTQRRRRLLGYQRKKIDILGSLQTSHYYGQIENMER